MNIRKHTVKTHIPGYNIEIRNPGFLGQKKVWVDSRWEEKTEYEYLNPANAKWEPIPDRIEHVYTAAPVGKVTAGEYSWD